MRRIGRVQKNYPVFAVRRALARHDADLSIRSHAYIVDYTSVNFDRFNQLRVFRIGNVINLDLIPDRRNVNVISEGPLFGGLQVFEPDAPNHFERSLDVAWGNDDGRDGRLGAYRGGDDIGVGPFSYEPAVALNRRAGAADSPSHNRILDRITACVLRLRAETDHIAGARGDRARLYCDAADRALDDFDRQFAARAIGLCYKLCLPRRNTCDESCRIYDRD